MCDSICHRSSYDGVLCHRVKKFLLLLVLTNSVLCNSEGIEYTENSENEELDDLVDISVFQEGHPVLPEHVLVNENEIFVDEALSRQLLGAVSAEEKTTENDEYVLALSAESVNFDRVVSFQENATAMEGNATVANTTSVGENKTSVKVECLLGELSDEIPTVQLINGTTLIKIFSAPANNSTAGECSIVMFYSPYCVFSARAAPHFNALARVFPGVKCYAVDAMTNGNLHLRYGLVAVPNVMLFHKGKPIARFNETYLNLERLVTFIEKYTGMQYNGTLNVTSADMGGPVPSTLSRKVDYVLILAWIFTICCLCYGFSKSMICHKIVESVKRTWQEAEAQHEHED